MIGKNEVNNVQKQCTLFAKFWHIILPCLILLSSLHEEADQFSVMTVTGIHE